MAKRKLSNKEAVAKYNKELMRYQLETLGYTTGESVGDIIKSRRKKSTTT